MNEQELLGEKLAEANVATDSANHAIGLIEKDRDEAKEKVKQLEAACAAMREALESVVGHANRRQLIATEGTEDPELHRLDAL